MPKYKDVMKDIEEENLAEWAHDVTLNLDDPISRYEDKPRHKSPNSERKKIPRPRPKKRK